jgi:fibronectin type 3 domain-containing protein
MTFLYSGCTKQPDAPVKVVIDKSLPTPMINGHISEMTAIAFEWQSINDLRVKGFYIYRSNPKEKNEKLKRIADIKSPYATHYVDTDLEPNTSYAYRFSSYNKDGVESIGSKTYRASTLPRIASVSFFRSIGNMPRSAKLIWRPHTDTQIKSYIIERKLKNENRWEKIATIDGRLNAEYIDLNLDDNEVYQYRLFAITYNGIKSIPSEIVTVVTKPLPATIQNIKATQTLPKKILLSWDPSQRENLAFYNIYRSSDRDSGYEYYVKLTETSFNDKIEDDGKVYYYKITAVDSDGLESLLQKNPVKGMSLAKPKTPLSFSGKIKDHFAILTWKAADNETVSYTLIKTKKESWLKSTVQEIKNIKEESFKDAEIQPDTAYEYQITSVNQYGIRSKPSEKINLVLKAK